MPTFSGYKTTAFKETQKFFVLDPNTGNPAFVNGSDLVSKVTPNSNYVYAESTRVTAQSTDYQIGSFIQTGGDTAAGDDGAALFLVVAPGNGDFPMDNGNDLLFLYEDDLLREQLSSAEPGEGASLVSFESGSSVQELESTSPGKGASLVLMEGGDSVEVAITSNTTAINQRPIYAGSVAELEDYSTPIDGLQASLSGASPGIWQFSTADLSTEVTGDPDQDRYIAPSSDPTGASGAWVRQWGVGLEIGDVVELEDVGGSPGLPAVDGSQLTGLPDNTDIGPEYNQVPDNDLARDLGSFSRHNFTGGSADLMTDIQFMRFWGSPIITPSGSGWQTSKVSNGAFSIVKIWDGYQAYFSGDGGGIGMMTSQSLFGPWTDRGTVLSPGGIDSSVGLGSPNVFFRPGPGFDMVMFYSYSTGGGPGNRIGFALSNDAGRTWSKSAASPVLSPGGAGAWDEGGVQSSSVFWDHDLQKWVMAYAGWAAGSTVTRGSIGIATCDKFDLGNWTKHPGNPVLTPTVSDGPEDFGLLSPTIWKEDGTYYLSYAAKRDDIAPGEPFEVSSVCIASGADFDSFVRNPANPIIDSRDYTFDEIECPQFIKIDDVWHAFGQTFVENSNIEMLIGVVNEFSA